MVLGFFSHRRDVEQKATKETKWPQCKGRQPTEQTIALTYQVKVVCHPRPSFSSFPSVQILVDAFNRALD
jgi:hypothetical protein